MPNNSVRPSIALAAFAAAALMLTPAAAEKATSAQGSEAPDGLTQNFAAEHEIGRRFRFDPADLPPPKTGPIVADRSLVVPYDGQVPQVPPGFTATLFASGLATRADFWCCPTATCSSPNRAPVI